MQYNHKKETEIYVKKVFICKMTKNMRWGVYVCLVFGIITLIRYLSRHQLYERRMDSREEKVLLDCPFRAHCTISAPILTEIAKRRV